MARRWSFKYLLDYTSNHMLSRTGHVMLCLQRNVFLFQTVLKNRSNDAGGGEGV
jgi:hypothetical protein